MDFADSCKSMQEQEDGRKEQERKRKMRQKASLMCGLDKRARERQTLAEKSS